MTPLSPKRIERSGLCIGCGSCVAHASRDDVSMQFDGYGQLKPTGSETWLRKPDDSFSRLCPFSPSARNEDDLAATSFPGAGRQHHLLGRYEALYVGHAEEGSYRLDGSSGGMVTWVASELLRLGLADGVAHVKQCEDPDEEGGLFRYTLSRSLDALRAGAKSRYYPVELSAVLREVREVPGRYAVIGIPCFIKAVRLACDNDPVLKERIAFTLGLVCGHMKSARMAESFAWQMKQDIDQVKHFDYRVKDPSRPANWYRTQLSLRNGEVHAQDWWHLADGDWGAGFFQNSACNFCDDVVAETADIAFGDAWREPYSSDGKGTNVVIVRSPVLQKVIQQGLETGRLDLSPVDVDFVVSTQAAGFRQRREGLAFRLTWPRFGIRPRKRVQPGDCNLNVQRKTIYVLRYAISFWSHRVFQVARWLRKPGLYIRWARASLAFYQGLAYSRGRIGQIARRLRLSGPEGSS